MDLFRTQLRLNKYTMASQAIVKKFYSIAGNGAPFLGVDIAKINGIDKLPYKTPPCFFLERELGKTARELYASNQYRHCKVYAGMFLDYITKKEFKTLEDWVADCGSDMGQVLFGYNKFDARWSYIRLDQLVKAITPPNPSDDDMLTAFMNKLAIDELGLKDIHINTHTNGMKPFDAYMAE